MRNDCALLSKTKKNEFLVEAIQAKQKYLFGFLIEYEQARYQKAKALKKTHDRTNAN